MLRTSHRLTLLHRQKVVATNKTTEHWYWEGGRKSASPLWVLMGKESAVRVELKKQEEQALPLTTPPTGSQLGALLGTCMERRLEGLMTGPEILYLRGRVRVEVGPSQWHTPAIPATQGLF